MKKVFVNIDKIKGKIRKLIDEVANDYKDEQYFELLSIADDTECEMLAEFHANKINDDMDTYMHRDNTKIQGNFNDIRRDYECEHKGCYYKNLLERLDKGATDEQTKADIDWITGWFWDTFGTWGFKYNLSTQIGEELYSIKQEESESDD